MATGTPAMWDASSLPPTARKYSPSGVLLSTTQTTRARTATITTGLGTPKNDALNRARNSGGMPKIGLPPV